MPVARKYMDFEKTWSVLKETVKKIIANDFISRDAWNEGFNNIYSLCVALPISQVDQLYLETKILLNEHVTSLLLGLRKQDEELILDYCNAWRKFSKGMHHLHCMYLHLNTAILKRKKNDSDIMIRESCPNGDYPENMVIEEMCLAIWKKRMIIPLKTVLAPLLLTCLHAERNGQEMPATEEMISEIIQSTIEVNKYNIFNQQDLYEELVEKAYLVDIHEFYISEITALNREEDIIGFMKRLMWRLNSDEFKTHIFLQDSSLVLMKQSYKDKIISYHFDWLLMKADDMIKHEQREDLALLYSLLEELDDSLESLASKFSQHVTDKGLEAISSFQEENVHIQFVENILVVYTKYTEFVKDVFKNDVSFFNALDDSWKVIVNFNPTPEQPIKASELLAKYCDSFLRKSVKTTSQDKIEEKMHNANLIFKYIDDKDAFQKSYARLLTKRFIQQQSQSMNAEESMISRFKESCGYAYTLTLYQMLKDMSVSEDLNIEFVDSLEKKWGKTPFGINFSVYLIRKDIWQFGIECTDSFLIPRQVASTICAFENFYQTKFEDRKLVWLFNLCQGELKLNYLKKPYQVTMQTYQMAILLLFEEYDFIRCKDAAGILKLPCDQLLRHAVSLVECNILNKSTEGELEEDTLLSLNFDYHNKRTKFVVKASPQKERPQTAQDTHRSLAIDQNVYLQTLIVRIMKSRKSLKYEQLEQEILNEPTIRFIPSIEMIKKSIATLVDKQYLEEIENDGCEYSYIA